MSERRKLGHDPITIHPSGRPVERAGFEAMVAMSMVVVWIIVIVSVFALMGENMAATGLWPTFALLGVFFISWACAEIVVGRKRLIWPGSALGVLGPLSLGFAVALSTPELRTGPFLERLAIVSVVSGMGMIPFLFRFKLPGLVSPIITFSLVGLFLELYGADVNRLKEMEGFSPRGIIAALMDEPHFMIAFAVMGLFCATYARKLDLKGGNFGLASARPLHLVGCGVTALIAGRLLGALPNPLDIAMLSILWIATHLWGLRINRIGAQVAMHFAMIKPLVYSILIPMGLTMDVRDWSFFLAALLAFDIAIWPMGHRCSRALNFTLGPGGKRPPLQRSGWMWRYWPYALEDDSPTPDKALRKDAT